MTIAKYQCSHTTFQGCLVNVLLTFFTVDQHSTSSHIPQIMGETSPSTKAGRNWEIRTRHENIISSTSWNSRWLDLSLLQVSTARLFFFFLRLHQNADEQPVFISGVRNFSCFPASLSYLTSPVLILHVIVGPLSYCLLNYHFNFEWTTDFNLRSVLILILNQNSSEFMTIRIYTTGIYLSWSCMSDLVGLNA